MKTIYLLLILALTSCSADKRLQRLVNKHPELIRKDTVTVSIPVYVVGISKDTIFNLSVDTMFLDTGRLHVEVHIDTVTRKVFVSGRCDPDTVTVTVDKIINSVEPTKVIREKSKGKIDWWWAMILMAIGLFLGWKIHK